MGNSVDTTCASLSDRERRDWLRLIRSDNIGPRTFHLLLRRYGSAAAALEALPALIERGGMGAATRLCSTDLAESELAALAKRGLDLVAWGESDYPPHLAAIEDAPPLLTVAGSRAALTRPMIAVVGARNASAAGLIFTERLAAELAATGLVVVSGLARGIDAAAHRASLATGTVAVLAGGHDRLYPPEHADLVQALCANGAAVSEMPLRWEPRPRDFPRRNRVVSGMALGVVVVEAAQRSGSLITARLALEQGRDVFAVPGSPLDPRTAGTNALLKQGAIPVTEAADILSVVAPLLGRPGPPPREPPEWPDLAEPEPADRSRVTALLGPTPIALDDLIRVSGVAPAAIRTMLLELEVAGRLNWHGGRVALSMS